VHGSIALAASRGRVTVTSERSRFGRWITFLRERSPLPTLVIVGLAQSLSAHYLFRSGFDAGAVAVSTLGIVGLLVLIRLMDELKDYAKDRVAHPDRPLPRGLLTPAEVRRGLRALAGALLAFAALLAVARRPEAAALYALTVGYTFLMYREFFSPQVLNRHAFAYALTHLLAVVPMYAFAVAMMSPGHALSGRTIWFALTALGASLAYDVGRKLDPDAHPALGTYLHMYGRAGAAAAIAAGIALLAIGAYRLDVHPIVWPFAVLALLTLPIIVVRPRRFRSVEGAMALLTLVQMLAPALRYAWRVAT
jgi:hypothetical protein